MGRPPKMVEGKTSTPQTVATKAPSKGKLDAFTAMLANIEKQMGNKGKPIIKLASEMANHGEVRFIPFGYPAVDIASNCGGIPRGKVVEIFGPESGGKSFLTINLMASVQKAGERPLLVDAEKSWDPKWARQNGLDPDKLYIIDDDLSAEDTLEYVNKSARSGQFAIIVVDSTAALIPQKELEGDIKDQDYALLARALSKGLKKIVASCGATGTTVVFINQIREKMGVMFGDSETTPGGRALKFYSHQRIRVSPGGVIKAQNGDKEEVVARKSYVKFVKNKVARPWGECQIEIVFDAIALNPVVKLANLARASGFKAIRLRDGEWTLTKDFLATLEDLGEIDPKKNLSTGAKSGKDMANFLISKGWVIPMINYVVEMKDGELDLAEIEIPKDVLEMLEDASKIVSPDATAILPLKGEVLAETPEVEVEDTEFAEKYDGEA